MSNCSSRSHSFIKTCLYNEIHSFHWSVENFSKLDYIDTTENFPFRVGEGECGFRFVKDMSEVKIIIGDQTEGKLEYEIQLCDREGKVLKENSGLCPQSKAVKGISVSDCSKWMHNLPNDELIIICKLKSADTVRERRRYKAIGQYQTEYLKQLSASLKELSSSTLREKVDLCCDDDQTITVNKAILCVRSSYFAKMFETDMKERGESKAKEDIEMPVLKKLVSFLYTGKIPESDFDTLCKLYIAANKYFISELQATCTDNLVVTLTLNNACDVLRMANQMNDSHLKTSVMDYLCLNFQRILETDYWLNLVLEEPELSLEVIKFIDNSREDMPQDW